MKLEDLVQRINELYKKNKEVGLSEEEKDEQAKLRRIYIDRVKNNFKSQLDGIKPNNPTKKS